MLGHRLAGTADVELQALPARRVAGRSADGVRLLPRDPDRTTVEAVDLWVDPGSGLPLRVEVRADGEDEPVLTSLLLDLDLGAPPASSTDFDRPRRADVTVGDAPDVAAAVDRFAPYRLPESLAGLPRRPRAPLTGDGGVATYGEGLTAMAVLPLPGDVARRLVDRIDDDGDGRTARVSTPLVNAQVSAGRRAGLPRRRHRPRLPADRRARAAAGRPAAPPGGPAIRTRALVKRYGRVTAVDGIDLDVQEGDRYGFLGPNGSGKTTTVRMLLGLVLPTSGEVELLGSKPGRENLGQTGALVEGPAFVGHLSGRANLRRLDAAGPGGARRDRRRRVGEVLEQVGLSGVDRRPVKAYSLGMRQRLGLAAALLRKPRLLVLDEPTNGLDPAGIREVRELLLALNREGTTVFLSSHLLSEVEALCTRIGVVDRGRLVLQDELSAFQQPTGLVAVTTPDLHRAATLLGDDARDVDGDALLVRADDPALLNATLVAAGIRVAGIAAQRRTLESAVLEADRRRLGPGRPVIGVELRGLLRRPRTWVSIAPALPAADGRRGLPVRQRGRAAPRYGPGVPVGGAGERRALPGRRARHRAAAVPAGRRRGRRRRRRRGGGAGRHAALPAGPARRPHQAARRQARRRHGVHAARRRRRLRRRLRRRHHPVRRQRRAAQHVRHRAVDAAGDAAHGAGRAVRRLVDARRRGRRAVPVDAHRLARWPRRSAPSRCS